ncbi:hypothetical protein ABTD49_21245, partial [Acinetobacter baumannii]
GISQVSLSLAEMDRATQQNAALVEQTAAAADALTERAATLTASVAVFTLTAPQAMALAGTGGSPALPLHQLAAMRQ